LIGHLPSTDIVNTFCHSVADFSKHISLGESADGKATTDRREWIKSKCLEYLR
jgi:hypothetical protein